MKSSCWTPRAGGRWRGWWDSRSASRRSASRRAAAGGQPARMGEVQVWDVAQRKLLLSAPVTSDTLYGVRWSPDGKRIAFGCGDNSVRAIDAQTGKQELFMGSHTDWALDTVFSA